MNLLEAVILGVVEGVTEFLPVSSTGHLILTSSLLGVAQTDFLKSFEIAIQLGAILAVVVLYYPRFLDMQMLIKLAAGFVPTALIGFFAYPYFKAYLLGNSHVVAWSLLIGGAALIAFETLFKREVKIEKSEALTWQQSAIVGLFQAIAIIPGVSRSAATIVGGLLMGMSRTAVVEFSFLLAVPTMVAATGYDLLKNAGTFHFEEFGLLIVGFIVSFLVALAAIRWLLRLVRSYTFIGFGVYRIVIALAFLLFIL